MSKNILKKGEILVITRCLRENEDENGFKYPKAGELMVEAPDWDPRPIEGHGLYGWTLGEEGWADRERKGNFVVIKVQSKDGLTNAWNGIKFRRGLVIYNGPHAAVAHKIMLEAYPTMPQHWHDTVHKGEGEGEEQWRGAVIHQGDCSVTTISRRSAIQQGDFSQASQGGGEGTVNQGNHCRAETKYNSAINQGTCGRAWQGDGSTCNQDGVGEAHQGAYSTINQVNSGTAYQGYRCTANQGHCSTVVQGACSAANQDSYCEATQGESSILSQGYCSVARIGNNSVVQQGSNGVIRLGDGSVAVLRNMYKQTTAIVRFGRGGVAVVYTKLGPAAKPLIYSDYSNCTVYFYEGLPVKVYTKTSSRKRKLAQHEVLVFLSDKQGKHTSGAAKLAVEKFGAAVGVGEGLRGQSYALPVLGKGVSLEEVNVSLDKLAKAASDMGGSSRIFLLTDVSGNKNIKKEIEKRKDWPANIILSF